MSKTLEQEFQDQLDEYLEHSAHLDPASPVAQKLKVWHERRLNKIKLRHEKQDNK